MTNGSSAARQDLRRRRGLSKLEQGYMGFILILPWLIGFCIFKLYPFVSSLVSPGSTRYCCWMMC